MIEPLDEHCDAFDQAVNHYHSMMLEMVCNGLLDKMRKMARIIDAEPNGNRKEMMIEKYEQIDKELEQWQKTKTISDTLCKLDK